MTELVPIGLAMAPVVARGVGFALAAPLPAGAPGALRFRFAAAVLLGAVLAPMADASAAVGKEAALAAAASQAVLGCCLGLSVAVVVGGLEMVGALWSSAFMPGAGSGWSASDPWRTLLRWLGWLVFFLVGGHRVIVEGLLALPADPGASAGAGPLVSGIVHLVGATLQIAWQMALPIVFAQWTAYLALAAIARAAPCLADWNLASITTCLVLVVGAAWAWPSMASSSGRLMEGLLHDVTGSLHVEGARGDERGFLRRPSHAQAPAGGAAGRDVSLQPSANGLPGLARGRMDARGSGPFRRRVGREAVSGAAGRSGLAGAAWTGGIRSPAAEREGRAAGRR